MKLTYVEEGFRLEIGKVVIRFTKYEQIIDDICIGDHPSTLIYLYDEMAIEFIEKMEELENPFDANEIDENLYYPNEDISEEIINTMPNYDKKISFIYANSKVILPIKPIFWEVKNNLRGSNLSLSAIIF